MPNTKVDRRNELNKLFFKLHRPKEGDVVKFKIKGQWPVHTGKITKVEKDEKGDRYKYQMVSDTASPIGTNDIVIVEVNGVKFEEVKDPYDFDKKEFKPI